MKYCSIDIETTGLDPETCQILQVGVVIEDTVNLKPLEELPRFSCIVEYQLYQGQPFALNMNNWIIAILASLKTANKIDREKIRKENHIMGEGLVAKSLWMFLTANGFFPNMGSSTEQITKQITINVAGKNFASFDKKFLEKLPSWSNYIQFAQRIIDPAEFFTHWKEDERLPNLNECIRRANLSGEVTHDAVQDAIDVIGVIRVATNNYEKRLYM